MQGRTVFVIAHRLSTVRNSNAIMVLDHGRIIERGTHDDLLKLKGTYYQLYNRRPRTRLEGEWAAAHPCPKDGPPLRTRFAAGAGAYPRSRPSPVDKLTEETLKTFH